MLKRFIIFEFIPIHNFVQQYERGVEYANKIVTLLVNENRRSMDPIAAKCYFYYSRVYELTNQLEAIRRYQSCGLMLILLK